MAVWSPEPEGLYARGPHVIRAAVLALVLVACGSKSSPTVQSGSGPAARDPATLCTSTGGTIGSATCCKMTGDFPDLTKIGPCGCAPNYSHTVEVCDCPGNEQFSRSAGCRSSARL